MRLSPNGYSAVMRKGMSAAWRGVGWLETAYNVLAMIVLFVLAVLASIFGVVLLVAHAPSWWVGLLELIGIAVLVIWGFIVSWNLLVRRDRDEPAPRT
jgi:hypothetical protein